MSVTVITPAAVKDLTTVDGVKSDLGPLAAGATDQQIERFIGQASARAASYCRRAFGRQVVSERFDFINSWCAGLPLEFDPAFAIDSVSVGSVVSDPASYQFDGRVLYRTDGARRLAWFPSPIVVQYQSGWLLPGETRDDETVAPDLPLDIEQAVIMLVGVSLSGASRDTMVKSEDFTGIGRTDYYVQGVMSELPHPGAESILRQYRRVVFV